MGDDEILHCVAEALGIPADGGSVTPLGGHQGLIVCRVCLPGAPSCIFKAVRESARSELRLSAWLARAVPGTVPAVLRAEEDVHRGLYWLIMQDEGEARLADRPTQRGYVNAARTLARLQIETLELLIEGTAPDLRTVDPPAWEEMALSLLAFVEERRIGPGVDTASLSAALWRAEELAAHTSVLPMALIHGDLHAGNIVAQDDGSVRLLDWGSAYVGAAFLGLAELLWPAERYIRRIGDLGPIRKAYLDCWVPLLGKPGRLANAVAACESLARMSLIQEALRRPDRFGPFGAVTMANHFVEACRRWERTTAC